MSALVAENFLPRVLVAPREIHMMLYFIYLHYSCFVCISPENTVRLSRPQRGLTRSLFVIDQATRIEDFSPKQIVGLQIHR